MKTKTPHSPSKKESKLRDYALSFPGTTEAFPWGNRALKVGGKAFVFMTQSETGLSIGTKLPHSRVAALKQPFASPTHYGMGKHGWVTCDFPPASKVPLKLLQGYIRESYEAIAPKRLLASGKTRGKK